MPARRARQRRVELTRHFVGLRRLEPKRLQECYLDLLLKKNDIWDYDHFGESSSRIVMTFFRFLGGSGHWMADKS